MAKIRVARKSDVYSALLVVAFLFLAIGVFLVSYNLKTNYLYTGKGGAVASTPTAPADPEPEPEKSAE